MIPVDANVAHIGIAVRDVEEAAAFYRDVLGVAPSTPETADGATIVSIRLGEVDVELMQPLDRDGPVARFLDKRGPGIHHVCYRVGDLETAMQRCREAGYQLVDDTPRLGVGGHRIAFVHPKSTAGILLELTE